MYSSKSASNEWCSLTGTYDVLHAEGVQASTARSAVCPPTIVSLLCFVELMTSWDMKRTTRKPTCIRVKLSRLAACVRSRVSAHAHSIAGWCGTTAHCCRNCPIARGCFACSLRTVLGLSSFWPMRPRWVWPTAMAAHACIRCAKGAVHARVGGKAHRINAGSWASSWPT